MKPQSIVTAAFSALFVEFADAHRAKKDAETALENLREPIMDALRRFPNGISVPYGDTDAKIELGTQKRSYGITGESARKIKGIKPATLMKLLVVDTKQVKVYQDAGILTKDQADALITHETQTLIRLTKESVEG